MPEALCGFDDVPGGATGSSLLQFYGPTIFVDIGFDPDFQAAAQSKLPSAGMNGIRALVDTGAAQSCIDSLLAAQLNLPIIDRQPVSGVHGSLEVNIHLAQVYVPALNFVLHGIFAGVHLTAGGQAHGVLLGRAFLQHYTLIYEGRTGTVRLSSD